MGPKPCFKVKPLPAYWIYPFLAWTEKPACKSMHYEVLTDLARLPRYGSYFFSHGALALAYILLWGSRLQASWIMQTRRKILRHPSLSNSLRMFICNSQRHPQNVALRLAIFGSNKLPKRLNCDRSKEDGIPRPAETRSRHNNFFPKLNERRAFRPNEGIPAKH
ncbi:uncharacterized protein BYT42DRAFT_398223 [Radiomyces spectabilis]|uniref:uncharacterized protein n=1 Tax=Radiomyces spectabilis TaxID=64574 RepID=UPI00221EF5A2|nr:uncharacterized protein BYT42DRAFT_398223 [Radiomyces spectabilis]KAI8374276.1 hypothetical protein BYT42DRAFT_398223 [Radiomyces spectabilis]